MRIQSSNNCFAEISIVGMVHTVWIICKIDDYWKKLQRWALHNSGPGHNNNQLLELDHLFHVESINVNAYFCINIRLFLASTLGVMHVKMS